MNRYVNDMVTDAPFYYRLLSAGKQIKLMRQDRQMTQPEYASCLGVPFGTLQQWEQERVRTTKRNWEMLRDRG